MTTGEQIPVDIMETVKRLQSLDLDTSSREKPSPRIQLKMSRDEYIRKQNAVFREMSGQPSWGEMCSKLTHDRSMAFPGLVEFLQLYVASLDERIYTEVEAQEEAQKIVDNERQILLQKWENSSKEPLTAFEWLADQMALLQGEFLQLRAEISVLTEQRNELENLRADIKRKYAYELARRIRLEHAVLMLGRRLLAADAEIKDKNEKPTNTESPKLEAETPADREFSTEAHLDNLEKILNLPNSNASPQDRLSALIPLLGPRVESTVTEVLEASRKQSDEREKQLLSALEEAQVSGQIYLARADRLTLQCEAQRKEIAALVERSADLAITEKELRSENQAVKGELQDLRNVLLSLSSSDKS